MPNGTKPTVAEIECFSIIDSISEEDINRAEEPKYSTVIQSLSSFLKEKKEKNQ